MRLNINSINVDYEDRSKGIPLLLIHGFPLHRGMWAPQIEGLAGAARLLAPDLRGFGKSDTPAGPYGMEDFARDLDGLLGSLKIDRAVLCGFSMGGYIAFAFHKLFAEKVAGMILLDTRAEADTEEGKKKRVEMANSVRQRGIEFAVEAMLPKLLGQVSQRYNPQLLHQVASMIRENKQAGLINAQHAMAARPDSLAYLPEIQCPVLIAVGDQDVLTPVPSSEAMASRIAKCELKIVRGAGHLASMEYPEQVNAAIRDYLKAI